MKKVKNNRQARRRRKKRILLGTLAAVGAIILAAALFFVLHPFFLKTDTVIAEYGQPFDFYENISFVAIGSPEDVDVQTNVNTDKMGTYTATYTYAGHSEDVEIIVKDTTAPAITSKNVKTDTITQVKAEDFVESAEDAQNITYTFKEKPTDEAGTTKVTIIARDESNNQTEFTATLTRTADTTAPVISVPEETVTIKQGKELTLDDITASDDLDPSPTLDIDTSQVNTTRPGTYPVVVTSTDQSGNSAETDLQVEVIEDPTYGKKVVYLTFDDGPSQNTGPVLDVLKEYGVQATFFVTGNGEEYNDMITRAANEGHTIGLHTYTHDYSWVYSSDENYFKDLQMISDMVKDLTGIESKVIRFPGGSSNTVSMDYNVGIMSRLVEEVQERGYQFFDWNVSSGDAEGNEIDPQTLIANSETEGDALVILFHDGPNKSTTVEALPAIIEYYQSKGYVFAGLDVESFPAHHYVNN